jgi:tetratricopeptide (TPR) repeat protein
MQAQDYTTVAQNDNSFAKTDDRNIYSTDTIEDDQQRLEYYINMGNDYYANEQYQEAIEYYLKAKDIYEFAEIYSTLCLAYCAIEKEWEAKEAYKSYKKLAPKGEDIENLKKALARFEPVRIDWTTKRYQPTCEFWSFNYSFAPYFPIRHERQTYTGTVLHGFSIVITHGGYSLLKAELDLSFRYGKIGSSLYPTGITSYHTWGKSGQTLFNVDIKFKGRFFSKYPQFQIGDDIVGRVIGSFGGGMGHLSHTENALVEYYQEQEDETLSRLLLYLVNNFSYEASLGVYLSKKDVPNGLKIEFFSAGYWQFKSLYKMTAPHFGVRIGWAFARPNQYG